MKNYLLLGLIVLFSSNTLAHVTWAGYDKKEVENEIPALLKKTLNQYPELKGTLEFDIESFQLSLHVPLYFLSSVNYVLAGTPNINIYTLEMDVVDTGSRDIMKLNCPVNVKYEDFTGSFRMYFSSVTFVWGEDPNYTCILTHPEEGERRVFINPSLNPHHEFQSYKSHKNGCI